MKFSTKYEKWYVLICQRGQTRDIAEYTEEHHIIPESFFIKRSRKGPKGWLEGNPDDQSNLTLLTAREHAIAHWLLTKIHTSGQAKHKVLYAFTLMATENPNQTNKRYKLIPRVYQKAKKELAEHKRVTMVGELNPMKDAATRIKHQAAVDRRGKTSGMTGKHQSEKTKELMREKRALQAPMSEESKRSLSEWMSSVIADPDYTNPMHRPGVREAYDQAIKVKMENPDNYITCEYCKETVFFGTYNLWHGDYCHANPQRIKRESTCPHCGKTGGATAMKRWHFDNCKEKK